MILTDCKLRQRKHMPACPGTNELLAIAIFQSIIDYFQSSPRSKTILSPDLKMLKYMLLF